VDVDGELISTRVSSNLEAVLRQLRHISSVRVFWVDALCIDQDGSRNEEQIQIPKMGQIYAQAKEVYI
jgi:hypothetical protein